LTAKRVLVTGGAGFVGANLVRRLIADGHDVHLVLTPGRTYWRLGDTAERHVPHHLDLADTPAVVSLLAELRPEWIFHLATFGAYPTQNDFDLALKTNVVATTGLVQAALRQGFESLVVTGTSSEYGTKDEPPRESAGLDPLSYYAATKAAATILCRQLAASYAANLVILRLYSVYGPFEEPTRLIPSIIAESWNDRLPPLVDPDAAHDFVFVDDVVDAFIRCAERTDHVPGAIYNVGTGIQTSLREVVDVARDVLKVAVEPDWGSLPSRPWDTAIWQSDSSSLREQTGWRPRFSFRDGFTRTVEWFDARPEMRARYAAARGDSHHA
jgi:nucleoside-diphosphate-sugar epimerase